MKKKIGLVVAALAASILFIAGVLGYGNDEIMGLLQDSHSGGKKVTADSSAFTIQKSVPSKPFILSGNPSMKRDVDESTILGNNNGNRDEIKNAINQWIQWGLDAGGEPGNTFGDTFLDNNGNPNDTVSLAEKNGTKTNLSVRYKNVGVYDGKIIDVKATIQGLAKATGLDDYNLQPLVRFYPKNIGVSVAGVAWVKVKYEFLESGTNTPVSVEGSTSYWDIDGNQGIVVTNNNTGLFATNRSVLKYVKNFGNENGQYYVFDTSTASGNPGDENNKDVYGFSETFEGTSITRIYSFSGKSSEFTRTMARGGIFHHAYSSVETPKPVKKIKADYKSGLLNSNNANDITAYTYYVTQTVPQQADGYEYEQLEISDVVDSKLDILSTDIVNLDGHSVKNNLFTINTSGNTVKATATATAKSAGSDLYGDTFTLQIKVKPKANTMTTQTSIANSAKTVYKNVGDSSSTTKNSNEVKTTYIPPKTPIKAINKSYVKQGETFEYTITQQIQPSSADARYTKFEFSDALKAPLTATALKIYQGNTDVTNWFTINVGQTVTAKLNDPSRADFYGTRDSNGNEILKTYKFVITAKFKDDAYTTAKATGDYKQWVMKKDNVAATVYEVPNKASIATNIKTNETNEVLIHTYYNPSNPVKEVNLKYVNDITTFEYRVSQFIPALATFKDTDGSTVKPTYKSFMLKDTLGGVSGHSDAFENVKAEDVKIISTQYGGNKDLSKGNDKKFNVTIDNNTKTVTATATQAAVTADDFYGYTYTMIINAKIKEQVFADAGAGGTTVINNEATRTIVPTHDPDIKLESTTNKTPTTHVNPKDPKKAIKDVPINEDKQVRYEKDYQYVITDEVQPATEDNYYDSYVFTDTLEPPLQIKSKEDVKITQIDASGNRQDYTKLFDIVVNGNTVTASANKDILSKADFYGTRENGTDKEIVKTYEFELNVSLRNNAENIMDMSKYVSEDGLRYTIPNEASFTSKTPNNDPIVRKTNIVNVYYYPEPTPKKSVSHENITDLYLADKEYTYTIDRRVLDYDDELFYESFEFRDTLEDCLAATDNVVIKNESGVAVTGWFTIKVDGQNISATLKKENNNKNFYGHTYYFTITTKVKKNYNLDKWRVGHQYIIPNEASFVIDGKAIQKTNKVQVYINHQPVAVPKTSANIPFFVVLLALVLFIGVGYATYCIYKDKPIIPKGLKR